MILVITHREIDKRTGREVVLVSHGVDMDTGRNVVMSQETPRAIGAEWSNDIGGYILSNSEPDSDFRGPGSA